MEFVAERNAADTTDVGGSDRDVCRRKSTWFGEICGSGLAVYETMFWRENSKLRIGGHLTICTSTSTLHLTRYMCFQNTLAAAFYATGSGNEPVRDWLLGLGTKLTLTSRGADIVRSDDEQAERPHRFKV